MGGSVMAMLAQRIISGSPKIKEKGYGEENEAP